jgi:hypothetical protein
MQNTSLVLPLFLVLAVASGCAAPALKTIPMSNPADGRSPGAELRLPTRNKRLQADCDRQKATDCMDIFWRLESVADGEVIFRYRVVAPDEASARATSKEIENITLISEDGREAPARLSDRFELERLRAIDYETDGYLKTGRKEIRPRGDGSLVVEDETASGTVLRTTPRFSGLNYVVFTGPRLVDASSKRVMFRFKGGLLGGGAEWTFRFDGGEPVNAVMAPAAEAPTPARRTR